LRDLQLIEHAIEMTQKYGALILSGHSLGGALATLFSAELRYDYPEHFDVKHLKLFTFGCPRVWDKETALMIDSIGGDFRHVRLVNDTDFIAMMPLAKLNLLYHTGEVYFATDDGRGFLKRDFEFNFSPEPPDDAIDMLEQALKFAVTAGDTHLITAPSMNDLIGFDKLVYLFICIGGYLDRIVNGDLYSKALLRLPSDLRLSFLSLPIKISNSLQHKDSSLEAVKMGAAVARKVKKDIDDRIRSPPPPSVIAKHAVLAITIGAVVGAAIYFARVKFSRRNLTK
jgi:hypothetical protein